MSRGSFIVSECCHAHCLFRGGAQDDHEPEPHLRGRRLVRIKEFMEQIQADRHEPFGCSFMDSKFKREVKVRGCMSTLVYKCVNCGKETMLDTDKRGPQHMEVNSAVVLGALSAGGGYANVSEFATALDMPCMSDCNACKKTDVALPGWASPSRLPRIKCNLFQIQFTSEPHVSGRTF